eukprot:IDg7965t1
MRYEDARNEGCSASNVLFWKMVLVVALSSWMRSRMRDSWYTGIVGRSTDGLRGPRAVGGGCDYSAARKPRMRGEEPAVVGVVQLAALRVRCVGLCAR